jgi:ATP-dependent Lhr-like helicase
MLGESFPELDPGGITDLVRFLVAQGFLAEDAAVVQVGPRTEAEFGRGNYLELLASFTGSQLLTGRHGASEVGYIDPTALSGEKGERLLLLAGRSWKVKDVDWRKRIVWLEPAASGGRARWMGGARNIGREVCSGIRTALTHGAPDVVAMSRRARAAFETLAEALPVGSDPDRVADLRIGMGGDTWTYAGTKANRTLARLVGQGPQAGSKVRFDALTVQAPVSSVPEQLPSSLVLDRPELDALRTSIKFADCVPERLLAKTIVVRCFEISPTSGLTGA